MVNYSHTIFYYDLSDPPFTDVRITCIATMDCRRTNINIIVNLITRHISDHDAAIAFIKCPKATSKSFTREIWLYDQTDFARFNHMLTDINWNEKLCNFDDVDDM
jgi:hypothetical protein